VLAFHDLATPRDEIAAAVTKLKSDPQRVRLNKGVAGRGTTLLTAKQKARLVEMTTFYPWVDFEPIGLAS
jgi:hypothetical protein